MQERRRRRSSGSGRPPMRSPGRPPVARREDRQRFWMAIANGLPSEDAAVRCWVSQAVGSRWFRESGGMPSISLEPVSGRYLTFTEREEIASLHARHLGVRVIAHQLGRSPSTISRELRRNAATRGGVIDYRASNAQWHADRRAPRPKTAKLAGNEAVRDYVQERLGGLIADGDGRGVPGPDVARRRRRHGRRKHRRWATSWSPEQIANRLRVDFPHDETMWISHEAIYQALYIQARGAPRRELTACLRTGRALRVPRARSRDRGKKFVGPEIMISERPAEADDRAVPGHWEGDLILGLNSSALGTRVERTTRFTRLLPLPPMAGRGGSREHNRTGARRSRGRSRARRNRRLDRHAPRPAASLADLGPGRRDGSAREAPDRDGPRHLLLRPAQPLAARHQREHEWSASSVLPERHRSEQAQREGSRSRRPRGQHQTSQHPPLEDPRRSPQRSPTLTATNRCCDDPLNSPSTGSTSDISTPSWGWFPPPGSKPPSTMRRLQLHWLFPTNPSLHKTRGGSGGWLAAPTCHFHLHKLSAGPLPPPRTSPLHSSPVPLTAMRPCWAGCRRTLKLSLPVEWRALDFVTARTLRFTQRITTEVH
jgi:IS30 family transposase